MMTERSLPFELRGRRIWIAGHRGMVGSAIVRRLAAEGIEAITVGRGALDLTRQAEVEAWMAEVRPEVVVLAAAKVGGIHANATRPVDFLEENLAIQTNVIRAAHGVDVAKLLFLGSSCIYPKHAPQPIREDSLLTGPLEPTNEWYAIAKIAGLRLCQAHRRQHGSDFIACMPTNLYGPGDNWDLLTSHVAAALIRKMHDAREQDDDEVEVWGTGRPRREFLHVDDLANACVFLLRNYSQEAPINVGWGQDVSIAELAAVIQRIVGFKGRLRFDPRKPDGTPRKLLDTSRLAALGWQPRIRLADGLADAYRAYLATLGG